MKNPPILAALLVAIAPLCGTQAAEPPSRPNIVLFYLDDWAWNGSPVAMEDSMPNSRMPILHMPNIERLAREGMRFRNAYGSPQCSPARVCVQTGQSSPRNGFTVFLGSKENYYDTKKEFERFPLTPNVSDMEIDKEATTIPEALKPLGYVSAHIGKWHMRGDPGEHGYLTTQGDATKGAEPAKHKTTLPKPPAGNGTTPFIDPMFEYKEAENLTYGTAKSGDTTMPLLLDVYQPVATDKLPKKLPAMIFAFGGGWTKGSKDVKYIRDLCGYYAERGYVAISIQYRIAKDNPPVLAGPGPNPEQNEQFRLINAAFQDTCNAVRWVRTNADKYDIDPKRIGIGGVSAGAFNALHTGFCDDKLTGPDAEVAAVVSLMGAVDAKHIDKDDPPVFIAHGTSDNVVPYAMVRNMVARLESVKANYSFHPVNGVAHRLQTILDTKSNGKTVKDHSLDFCFEAMKLAELTKEAR